MAGAPSCGKMSTFIWRIAITEVSATESTATRIVIGRRMAVSTSHMKALPSRSSAPGPTCAPGSASPPRLFDKWREIARRLCRGEQRTPHAQSCDSVVHLGLREQPLRLGDFRDAGQTVLIASARLIL